MQGDAQLKGSRLDLLLLRFQGPLGRQMPDAVLPGRGLGSIELVPVLLLHLEDLKGMRRATLHDTKKNDEN